MLQTKIKAAEAFRQTRDIEYVMRRYHASRTSMYHWNKQYDGTPESLENKSHKPKTPHTNAHTERELKWINVSRLHERSALKIYGTVYVK